MAESGSQTLARGLTALALIGEAPEPLSVPALATALGIHRSMAYRLVKTLEDHGFVERGVGGTLAVGARLAALARGVARHLQAVAGPELGAIAEDLGMTAFLVTYDGEAAVTIVSSEPRNAGTTLAQRPGTRHSIDSGAPGHVLRSQLDPASFPPAAFETSRDEIFPGLASVAVPVRTPDARPASIAVLYLAGDVDVAPIATRLTTAARQIERALG